MSPAEACARAQCSGARWLGEEPGKSEREVPAPTHSSTPQLPTAPTHIIPSTAPPSHPPQAQPAAADGKPDAGHGKRHKNTHFNTTPPAFLLHTAPIRGRPPRCGNPTAAFGWGRGDGNNHIQIPLPQHSHPARLRGRAYPNALAISTGAAPLAECLPPRPDRRRRGNTKELRGADPPSRPFLHLPSPPVLQNRPWPFIKVEKKNPE